MPTRRFSLEAGASKRIEISWQGLWKNIRVSLDGNLLGSIPSQSELKAGRDFNLPDQTVLRVQLVQHFLFSVDLEISRNGIPLPGSGADPQQRLSGASGAIFFVAGMSMLLGLLAEVGVSFLRELGQGVYSIALGVVFLVLGFLVKNNRSKVALGIAMAIYAIDGFFFLKDIAPQHASTISGAVLIRSFLLFYMYRGFAAIRALNEDSFSAPVVNRVPTIPRSTPPPVLPPTVSSKSPSDPASLSFVSPVIRTEADRRRQEMSGQTVAQARAEKPVTLLSGTSVDLKPKPVAADVAASALRYLLYRCEIANKGMRAIYSSGKQKEYAWTDFSAIIIRQLPPDPPWEAKILMDLIPVSTTGSVSPIRLFTTTYVNYSILPQGVSPSSQENMRRLGLFVLQQNAAISLEPWTSQFLYSGKSPLRFANLSQFADYDARYS